MSEQKGPSVSEEMVVSGQSRFSLRSIYSRRWVLVALIALLLLAAAGIGYGVWRAMHPKLSLPYASPKTDAQAKANQIATLSYTMQHSSGKEKYSAESQLALINFNQGKYDTALKQATEVNTNTPTAASAAALADVYYAQKNYALAAKYYGIAMQRSARPSSPTERAPYNDYAILKKQAEELAK